MVIMKFKTKIIIGLESEQKSQIKTIIITISYDSGISKTLSKC